MVRIRAGFQVPVEKHWARLLSIFAFDLIRNSGNLLQNLSACGTAITRAFYFCWAEKRFYHFWKKSTTFNFVTEMWSGRVLRRRKVWVTFVGLGDEMMRMLAMSWKFSGIIGASSSIQFSKDAYTTDERAECRRSGLANSEACRRGVFALEDVVLSTAPHFRFMDWHCKDFF